MIANESIKTLRLKVGSKMRRMMSRALQTAIMWKDCDSTQKILQYAHDNKLSMHIYIANMDFLVDTKLFDIMVLLI